MVGLLPILLALSLTFVSGSLIPEDRGYSSSGWENDYDEFLNFACPAGQHLTRIISDYHSEGSWFSGSKDDRRFKFECQTDFLDSNSDCYTTHYLNDWDHPLYAVCGKGEVIAGLVSKHWDFKEDRRWKIKCCKIKTTLVATNCGWTGFANGWKSDNMDFRIDSDEAIVGLKSQHDNSQEDRRWQFKKCTIEKDKSCPRPSSSWCGHGQIPGYKFVDCDGDGHLDSVCSNSKNSVETIQSSTKDCQSERLTIEDAACVTKGPKNWMSSVSDETFISELSIPGTHDSASDERGCNGDACQCQDATLEEQLNLGVRAFDIRLSYDTGDSELGWHFDIHHGSDNLDIDFDYVLYSFMSFLLDNPSETIVMSYENKLDTTCGFGKIPGLNCEAGWDRTKFQKTFQRYLDMPSFQGLFYKGQEIPTMQEARGKIVMINFKDYNRPAGEQFGLIEKWTASSVENDYAPGCNPQSKLDCDGYIDALKGNMKEAMSCVDCKQLYITYLSAQKWPSYTPEDYSDTVNPSIQTWIEGLDVEGQLGLVMMDYPSAAIIEAVYTKNF